MLKYKSGQVGQMNRWTEKRLSVPLSVCPTYLLLYLSIFPIFHFTNFPLLQFSMFPLFQFSTCLLLHTHTYHYIPLYTHIYPYKVVSTTNIALRIVLEFCTLLRGGIKTPCSSYWTLCNE